MKTVQLEKDRDLLDPNFSGYKLSLESVSVTSLELYPGTAAEPQQPKPGQSVDIEKQMAAYYAR